MSKNTSAMHDFTKIINYDLRPQDDFYQFVNDKWLSENSIPEEESRWGNFMQLHESTLTDLYNLIDGLMERDDLEPGSIEQKVRDFYISGKTQEKAESSAISYIQSWLEDIDNCDKDGLGELLGRLHAIGIYPLFGVYVDQDEEDSSSYLLRFSQAGLTLPTRDYYLDDSDDMQALQDGMKAHIGNMFEAVGAGIDKERIESIYSIEARLAEHSLTPAQLRDVEYNYNKIDYDSFTRLASSFKWSKYFTQLDVEPPAMMSADQPEFFRFIDSIITSEDMADLRAYIKWHVVMNLARFGGEHLAEKNFAFFGTKLNGIPTMKPRWKRLIANLDDALGEALGYLYVEQHFPKDAKRRMEVLADDLKTAFARRIEQLGWLQPETKKAALEKLEAIEVNVGYPDEWRSYDGLDITADSYIKNYCEAAWFETKRQLNKLGQPVDRNEWHMTPQTVNAYFSPNMNSINFPAGILQPPFFDYQADDGVNYGGIGVVIGHELTHGFDDMGAQFDKDGNFRSWWSQADTDAFNERTETVRKQGDSYEAFGRNMDGQLTLGESIADIGGLAIAYDALGVARQRYNEDGKAEDGYSLDERFFFNFARIWREHIRPEAAVRMLLSDEHPPNEYRVNNTVRNLGVFYELFDIKPDDPLYLAPSQRADIW